MDELINASTSSNQHGELIGLSAVTAVIRVIAPHKVCDFDRASTDLFALNSTFELCQSS
jgi:hypothetical protein